MRQRRRVGADVLLLCGLLLVLAVAASGIARKALPPEDPENPRRSAASPRPGGWKGWFLLLREQGLRPRRIEREPRDWPADLRVLVAGPPYRALDVPGETTDWDDRQVKAALAWVEAGRTLILLADKDNALLRALQLSVRREARTDATLFPLQPAPFLAGVDGLRFPGTERFSETPPNGVALFRDDKPAVVAVRRGKGTVIAISAPALADNKHLVEADNARFLAQLAAAYAGPERGVGFDEFRQGYRSADTLWGAIGRPGQLVFWQILALALLAAFSASRRFGLPRPLPAPPRVSSEYVASLADLYRRAGAADAALEGVYLAFWRDLCRAVSLPLDTPTDEVVRRAARTLGPSGDAAALEERLRRAVNECEAKIEAGKVRDGDLLPLALALESLRKELGLGGHDDDIEQRRAGAPSR